MTFTGHFITFLSVSLLFVPLIPRTRSNSLENVRWNALQPPPYVTQITYTCLPPVWADLRSLRWIFHILYLTKKIDKHETQSSLRNVVVHPIRRSQSRDPDASLFCFSVPLTILWNSSHNYKQQCKSEHTRHLFTVSTVKLCNLLLWYNLLLCEKPYNKRIGLFLRDK